jgi:hypothetical protein
MKKFSVLITTTVLLSFSVTFLSTKIVKQLNLYKSNKNEISEVLNFENRILDIGEYIPFLGDGDSKLEEWDMLYKEASIQYELALKYGFVLLVVVLIYTFINYLAYQRTIEKERVLGIVFVFASLSFLYLGLQNPFLEVEAYSKDLELSALVTKTFEGRTYYLYQNKSVMELIKLLFSGGNLLVGSCVVLFSIVFPLFKLFASLFVLVFPSTKIAQRSLSIINKLGKWSMADVFISAVFLSVFSFSNMNVGVDTSSNTLIGLYFFLAFVILSIVSGQFLKHVIKHNKS